MWILGSLSLSYIQMQHNWNNQTSKKKMDAQLEQENNVFRFHRSLSSQKDTPKEDS